MRLLAVSGSLRSASSNTTALLAAALLCPPGMQLLHSDHPRHLPHFNPDEEHLPSSPVTAWREALEAANGVLFCTPEYAHGLPGSLKNALDWCVGSGEFVAKPIAVLNISPLSTYADASLREVLRTMDARVFPSDLGAVMFRHTRLDASSLAATPEFAGPVKAFLEGFAAWATRT